MGGAGHASPLLNDSLYLNPSFTSFNLTHSLSFNYLSYQGNGVKRTGEDFDLHGKNINISVLDGTSETLFQAAVGYTRRDDLAMLHIGASKSILQRIGFGIGAKFIFPNNRTYSKMTDATFSISGILNNWFQAAFIIDNLFQAAKQEGFLREYTLGTKISLNKIILFYIDPHWNETNQLGYEMGAEFPFLSDIFFRLGSFKNASIPYQNRYGKGYGIGFGWLAPKLSLDYAYSKALAPSLTYSHHFGMSIYF